VIYVLGVGLVNAQSNPQENCETVFYFAWSTSSTWESDVDPGITEEYLRSLNMLMPVYGSALCLDEDNHATVEYVPGHFYVKKRMQEVLREINEDKQIEVEVRLKPEDIDLQPKIIYQDPEHPLKEIISAQINYILTETITVTTDNPDFIHYLEKRMRDGAIYIIREEKNAIPDINWRPEFKVTFQYPDNQSDFSPFIPKTGKRFAHAARVFNLHIKPGATKKSHTHCHTVVVVGFKWLIRGF